MEVIPLWTLQIKPHSPSKLPYTWHQTILARCRKCFAATYPALLHVFYNNCSGCEPHTLPVPGYLHFIVVMGAKIQWSWSPLLGVVWMLNKMQAHQEKNQSKKKKSSVVDLFLLPKEEYLRIKIYIHALIAMYQWTFSVCAYPSVCGF